MTGAREARVLALLSLHILIALAADTTPARAEDACEMYKRLMPRVYEVRCAGGGGGKSRAGEAYSSFADSCNINPASLPTTPTPYGLEVIESYPSESDRYPPAPTLALIKGFHKIGTAVSTGGNTTFYGNDVGQRVYGTTPDVDVRNPETPQGKAFNLNAGTSISLGGGGGAEPSLGVSLRYNHITSTIGWGTGLAVSMGKAALGFGVSRETVSNRLPTMTFASAVVAYKLPIVEFEYTYLTCSSPFADPDTSVVSAAAPSLNPVHILTATAPLSRLILSTAVRRTNYLLVGDVWQFHAAAQVQIFSHLAVGYLINYIPGTHSIAAQIFL